MDTFQFEDSRGPFWKQHKVEPDIYAADGHRYSYGKITGPQRATHYGYALHSLGCRCVLRRLAEEMDHARALTDSEDAAREYMANTSH